MGAVYWLRAVGWPPTLIEVWYSDCEGEIPFPDSAAVDHLVQESLLVS
jgi:hypothetical protein